MPTYDILVLPLCFDTRVCNSVTFFETVLYSKLNFCWLLKGYTVEMLSCYALFRTRNLEGFGGGGDAQQTKKWLQLVMRRDRARCTLPRSRT